MSAEFFNRVSALADAGHIVTVKLVTLCAVLVFFLVLYSLRTLFKRGVSPSKVAVTMKLALLGLVLLLVESQLRSVPFYGNLLADASSLVALLCLANLVGYLVVDVYCYYRMDRQVPSFIRDLLTMLVYVGFALISLRVIFHLDVGAILTTTTVLTAAIAFAMQTTIANVASGFYVEGDANLRRDSWISIKDLDVAGKIVNTGFRYVTLRTLDNQRVLVPNNYIMQNVVVNLGSRTEGERTAHHLKVGLGYDLPPERAIAIMTRILREEPHVEKEPAPIVLVSNFLDSAIEYNLKYYLDDYAFHAITRGSVLSKIWYAVTREGFSIPYPHRELIQKSAQEPFRVEDRERAGVLQRADLLRSLGADEFQRLSGLVRYKVFGPGEVVVRQGDEGDSLFVVRRGELKVSIDGAEVGALREGDVFGEMSLLTGERRKATVAAAGEVHLVELAKEHIEPVIRANPALLEKLSAILALRAESNVEARRRAELAQAGAAGKDAFLTKLRAFFGL